MFVFDPLAIALVLASNFAFSRIKIQNSEEPQLQTPPLKDLREEESIVNDEMEITFETTLDPQIAIESPVQNHEEIKQDSEEESNENLDKYNEKVFGGYKASKNFQVLNQKNKTATAQAQRIRILALKYKYQTA
jgi:hypothetical protein